MKRNEIRLFNQLCRFNAESFDESLLEYASPNVLGHLFFNRMQAIAYGVLKKHGLLSKVNREFRTSIKCAYSQNIEKNNSYFKCLNYINELLSDCKSEYAMLKGAALCRLYPLGYRTSNDIDILITPDSISKIARKLLISGFQQGHIHNDEFTPATRKEVIESKMMRGETVPYIKEVNLPGMRYLEIDINFSLDYKNSDDDVIPKMLKNSIDTELEGVKIKTLDILDFFIHLCGHLYKEATTLPWIEMKRDMTLYKYCDIYMLLANMDEDLKEKLFERAVHLRMEKICAFAILQTIELFEMDEPFAMQLSLDALEGNCDFIHQVIAPSQKKVLIYKEKNILKRFFTDNRKSLLEETDSEKIENAF